MRILLTGGAGFIGSHTAVEMAQSGHDVVIFDNFSNSDASVLDRLEKILGYRLPLLTYHEVTLLFLLHQLVQQLCQSYLRYQALFPCT